MKKLLTLAALLVSVVLAGCVNTNPTEETEPVAPAVETGPVVEPTPAEVTPEVTPAAEVPAVTGGNVSGTLVAPVAEPTPVVTQ